MTSTSHDSDIAAIRALSADWLAALKAGDVERLLAMITDDAVFMAPGMAPLQGKAAAEALYRKLFEQFSSIEQAVVIQEIVVAGDWAFSLGSETVTLPPAAGAPAMVLQGQGIAVLRRHSDGGWRYARALTNALPRPGGAR